MKQGKALKLSGCNPEVLSEGKFTCDDGQCVTMEQRCDQVPDCRDKSDHPVRSSWSGGRMTGLSSIT